MYVHVYLRQINLVVYFELYYEPDLIQGPMDDH
jgi:hypothetical protein